MTWKRAQIQKSALSGLLLLLVAIGPQCLGCVSPERRYELLTIFLDGVPPPRSEDEAESGGEDFTAGPTAPPENSVHPPYAEDRCDACHNFQNARRLYVPKEKICRTCHKGDQFSGAWTHGPVAASQCQACHHHHKSENAHLLLGRGSSICNLCHTEQTFAGLAQHKQEKGADCLSCHTPHVSEGRYLLR